MARGPHGSNRPEFRSVKTLDSHLTRRLLFAVSAAMVALLLLFVVIDVLTHRRSDILLNDVPASTVGLYYLLLVPRMLLDYHLGALATLLATLFVLGSAAQHNEFTALHSCGVPLRRIARAPLLIAAAVSFLLLLMGETFGPASARAALAIEEQYFGKHTRGSFAERPGISWSNLSGGWTCHIDKFNRVALTGEHVLMLKRRDTEHEMIRARRMYWDPQDGEWILEDAIWTVFFPEKGMAVKVRRVTQEPAPLDETPEELFAPFEDTATRNAAGLRGVMENASRKGMPLTRLKVDYYTKFSKPILPLVMIWLAVPFASRARRGGLSMGFGVSIALGISYLLVFSACQNLGYAGHVTPFMGAWLANFAFLIAGTALFTRTPT